MGSTITSQYILNYKLAIYFHFIHKKGSHVWPCQKIGCFIKNLRHFIIFCKYIEISCPAIPATLLSISNLCLIHLLFGISYGIS